MGEATGNVSDCQRMTAVIVAYMNMTSQPHNHMESRAVSHTQLTTVILTVHGIRTPGFVHMHPR